MRTGFATVTSLLALGALTVLHGQLPPSIRAAGASRAGEPLTEAERNQQCADVKMTLDLLRRDTWWLRDQFSARELADIEQAQRRLGCASDMTDRLAGSWIIASDATPGSLPVRGRMTLKKLDSPTGRRRSEENWGTFSLKQECAGSDEFYYSEDLTWDPGSFFVKEYFFWPKPTEQGLLLMCDDHGHFEGRFRARSNEGVGELFKITSASASEMEGKIYPQNGHGPSSLPLSAKRAGR